MWPSNTVKAKYKRDCRDYSWLRVKTTGKEQTWGANNLWSIFLFKKTWKKSPARLKIALYEGNKPGRQNFCIQRFVDALYLTAKVSKRSGWGLFQIHFITACVWVGGMFMLLKAEDEWPLRGQAQQGGLPPRAQCLFPGPPWKGAVPEGRKLQSFLSWPRQGLTSCWKSQPSLQKPAVKGIPDSTKSSPWVCLFLEQMLVAYKFHTCVQQYHCPRGEPTCGE
jgi:hypothetical protein